MNVEEAVDGGNLSGDDSHESGGGGVSLEEADMFDAEAARDQSAQAISSCYCTRREWVE